MNDIILASYITGILIFSLWGFFYASTQMERVESTDILLWMPFTVLWPLVLVGLGVFGVMAIYERYKS